jgi:hypothetical protein
MRLSNHSRKKQPNSALNWYIPPFPSNSRSFGSDDYTVLTRVLSQWAAATLLGGWGRGKASDKTRVGLVLSRSLLHHHTAECALLVGYREDVAASGQAAHVKGSCPIAGSPVFLAG